jgi:hypothetical protein
MLSDRHAEQPRLLEAGPGFERHIKRLAWYALLGVLVLASSSLQSEVEPGQRWGAALAALVLVVAIWSAVKDVSGYIRLERERRRTAALAVQDRVANALSRTVTYTDILAADTRLPADAREQARLAGDAARAAARAVSEFKDASVRNDAAEPAVSAQQTASASPGKGNAQCWARR